MTNATLPPRPKRHQASVIEAACKVVLDEVCEWAEIKTDDQQRDQVLKGLIRSADEDAYRFARNLERYEGWDCDAELVEVLMSYSPYQQHVAAVRLWVADNAIKVPNKLGDVVLHPDLKNCRIVHIRDDTAELTVQPVIPDGTNYGPGCGRIVPFENVQPA